MATEVDGCVDGADTAWVLLSFVLVLVMFPGLALFEAGLLPVSPRSHCVRHRGLEPFLVTG